MRRNHISAVCVLLLIFAMFACNTPGSDAPPPTEDSPAIETEVPVDTPPLVIETPTVIPELPPDPLVVIHDGGNFNIYLLDGTLVETRPAPGMENWPHPNSYQVIGDAIYYVDSGGSGMGGSVKRATAVGVEDLPYTSVPNLAILKFAVSEDESKIAWAAGEWGNSHLWVANVNGVGIQLILESDPTLGLEDYYVLETYRWTVEGDLLFAWQISGIGNILYFGYSSMYRYNPLSGEITALYEAPPAGGGPCWHSVSEDGFYLVGTCMGGLGNPGLREREVSTGIENLLPLLPNQDQTGAVAYSPSGTKLAYAYARGGMDDVDGYIAVRLNPGEDPITIASVLNGYFQRVLWVDENRLVVQGSEADSVGVLLLTLEGVITPIADGELIGLIQP